MCILLVEGEETEEIYVSEEVTLQPSHQVEYIEEEYLDPEPERPPPPPPPKKQKIYYQDVIARNNQLLKRVGTFLAHSDNLSQSTVWCRKLEKLDPTQRFYAEKAINDILFEAALGKLHTSSVSINGENGDSQT